MHEKPWNTTETSGQTGIPEETLRWWRSLGRGPRCYQLGRRVVYDPSDVRDWLESQKAATSRGGQ